LAVTAILVGAAWSLTSAPPPTVALRAGELALPNGLARVDQVASAARPQHAMPGMGTDNDPVAEGDRRVSVDVTLRATGDDPVEYDADDFQLLVNGNSATKPRRAVLPGSVLQAGTQLSGTLVFDVPRSATKARLAYDGQASAEVTLPPETGAGNVQGQSPSTQTTHSVHP
jgi:hypothetical protein